MIPTKPATWLFVNDPVLRASSSYPQLTTAYSGTYRGSFNARSAVIADYLAVLEAIDQNRVTVQRPVGAPVDDSWKPLARSAARRAAISALTDVELFFLNGDTQNAINRETSLEERRSQLDQELAGIERNYETNKLIATHAYQTNTIESAFTREANELLAGFQQDVSAGTAVKDAAWKLADAALASEQQIADARRDLQQSIAQARKTALHNWNSHENTSWSHYLSSQADTEFSYVVSASNHAFDYANAWATSSRAESGNRAVAQRQYSVNIATANLTLRQTLAAASRDSRLADAHQVQGQAVASVVFRHAIKVNDIKSATDGRKDKITADKTLEVDRQRAGLEKLKRQGRSENGGAADSNIDADYQKALKLAAAANTELRGLRAFDTGRSTANRIQVAESAKAAADGNAFRARGLAWGDQLRSESRSHAAYSNTLDSAWNSRANSTANANSAWWGSVTTAGQNAADGRAVAARDMADDSTDSWQLFRTTVATDFSNRTDAWVTWLNGPSVVTNMTGPIQSLKVVLGVVTPWITLNQQQANLEESTVQTKSILDSAYSKNLATNDYNASLARNSSLATYDTAPAEATTTYTTGTTQALESWSNQLKQTAQTHADSVRSTLNTYYTTVADQFVSSESAIASGKSQLARDLTDIDKQFALDDATKQRAVAHGTMTQAAYDSWKTGEANLIRLAKSVLVEAFEKNVVLGQRSSMASSKIHAKADATRGVADTDKTLSDENKTHGDSLADSAANTEKTLNHTLADSDVTVTTSLATSSASRGIANWQRGATHTRASNPVSYAAREAAVQFENAYETAMFQKQATEMAAAVAALPSAAATPSANPTGSVSGSFGWMQYQATVAQKDVE